MSFSEIKNIQCGDELGIFMLGSTTVVVLDKKAKEMLNPKTCVEPKTVLMGQSLSQ